MITPLGGESGALLEESREEMEERTLRVSEGRGRNTDGLNKKRVEDKKEKEVVEEVMEIKS